MRMKTLCAIVLAVASILRCCQVDAQDAASAKAFLRSVYHHYQGGGEGISFDGPRSSLYFHSSLLALEKTDVKASGPGNVPAIDWDPVCGCQDWEGIWNLEIKVHMENPQRAMVNVSFALSDPKSNPADATRKLEITLMSEHGQWRIYDVLDQSDPKFASSVRQLLQKDLADLRSQPAPASH
jgi:hypothetical protein